MPGPAWRVCCGWGVRAARLARGQRGLTLIELMVVLVVMALASGGVMLAVRDSAQTALERDAQRLAAVLEAARVQSRTNGVRAVWQTQAGGFVVQGLPGPERLHLWAGPDTRAESEAAVVLGPEPLLAAQQVRVFSAAQPHLQVWVSTDGLRPFAVQPQPQAAAGAASTAAAKGAR